MSSEVLTKEGINYTKLMYYVYILRLVNKQPYVGSTDDLKKRVRDHNHGKYLSTKQHLPAKLHWYCCFNNKIKALQFEKYLKSGSGTAFRHRRIE